MHVIFLINCYISPKGHTSKLLQRVLSLLPPATRKTWAKGRMDGLIRVLRPFNSISVISRRWKGEHERLCAMKRRLGSGRISPPAGFEPATGQRKDKTILVQVRDENRVFGRRKTDFQNLYNCESTDTFDDVHFDRSKLYKTLLENEMLDPLYLENPELNKNIITEELATIFMHIKIIAPAVMTGYHHTI